MTVKTYLKRHPEIQEYYLESELSFALYRRKEWISEDNIPLGDYRIKRIEEAPEPGELMTIHI